MIPKIEDGNNFGVGIQEVKFLIFKIYLFIYLTRIH
jgi:hypothetical protein